MDYISDTGRKDLTPQTGGIGTEIEIETGNAIGIVIEIGTVTETVIAIGIGIAATDQATEDLQNIQGVPGVQIGLGRRGSWKRKQLC